MNKRILILLPAFMAFFVFSCNKESVYQIQLHNISEGPIRVEVSLDPAFAAPGQVLQKLDKTVLQGQIVEVYYNKGLGIDLPMKDDTTLRYVIRVSNADTIYTTRNLRNINNYSKIGNEQKKLFIYESKITPLDFPE
jgi:hypothetical protein